MISASPSVPRISAGNFVDAGQFVPARDRWTTSSAGPPGTQAMAFGYFYADHTETISTLTTFTGGTAAGATPTLCRMGLYSVAANGDLTLIASTPNDTTLFAATFTAYPKNLSTPVGLNAGLFYAAALLIVTAATFPVFHGAQYPATGIFSTISRVSPPIAGRVTSLSDLPSSVAVGSIVGYQSVTGFQLS